MNRTDELRTARIESLVTPAELALRYPVTPGVATHVTDSRRRIEKILNGEDKRLLVIIGPCSIHDLTAAMEYATRLQSLRNQYQSRLEIVMRTYFEKPRTVVGWKGLISDPDLNGSYRVNHGLELARKLLLQVNELGVPTATEFLDMVTGQFIADLISWGAIGARTTESQIHREMASALSCPVGFKKWYRWQHADCRGCYPRSPRQPYVSLARQKWSDDHLSDQRQPVWPHYYAWRQKTELSCR